VANRSLRFRRVSRQTEEHSDKINTGMCQRSQAANLPSIDWYPLESKFVSGYPCPLFCHMLLDVGNREGVDSGRSLPI
jgi:hypothetical protein